MAQVALAIDLDVNIVTGSNASSTASVQKITDSLGIDRTNDFRSYVASKSLPISTQAEIEQALEKFVVDTPLP